MIQRTAAVNTMQATMSHPTLRIVSHNIHKGMSVFNRRHTLPALRLALASLQADLIFLQEVQGEHQARARQHADWPSEPPPQYLAQDLHHVYGRNAVYTLGHHGNALLSRFAIGAWHNHDLTLNRLEQRGLLHSELLVPGWTQPLHTLCVHLNLRASDRLRQIQALIDYAQQHIPASAPLIVAGDFNDWRQHACQLLATGLGVHEAFHSRHGRLAASFPARLPILQLDRIYVRGFAVLEAEVHAGPDWQGLSDHAPISALLRLQ